MSAAIMRWLFGRCAPDAPDIGHPGGTPAGTPSGDPTDVDGDGRPDADDTATPGEEEKDTDCDEQAGSFVVCTNQTLGESLPIAGTPFSLDYLSSGVPGWAVGRRFTLPIDVPEENLPSAVVVEVGVAGRLFTDTLDAVDQDYDFEWDGRDAYGRLLRGGHRASVRLGYRYFVSPRVPEWRTAAVSQFATTILGVSVDGNPYRHAVLFSEPSQTTLGQPGAVTAGGGDLQLGGWTLSAHHVYDPGAGVLYLGNGQRLGHVDEGRFIYRYAGNGEWDQTGTESNGQRALDSPLEQIGSMLVGADGSLYLGGFSGLVHRIDAETGIISVFAGGGTLGEDGVLATEARLYSAAGMAWGPDGSLYMVSSVNSRVRRIAPDGRVYTVAGPTFDAGPLRGYSGDGGPAVAGDYNFDPSIVLFDRAQGIGVAGDGTVYIADIRNEAIRRVSPAGIITTVARTGGVQGRLRDLDVTPDGEVLFLHDNLLSRLGADGTQEVIAGQGSIRLDGLPATEQSLDFPFAVRVGADGTIYVSEGIAGNNTVKVIQPNGIMATLAGAGPRGDALGVIGDGGPALKAEFFQTRSIAVSPDGDLYVNVGGSFTVRVVPKRNERFNGGDLSIPSPDASLLYRFDAQGRHLETYEAATGVRVYAFEYDGGGLLTGVVDRDGLRTTIARGGAGTTTITGPYGHTTVLTEDGAGYLQRFAGPEDQVHEFTYTESGLLASQLDPAGNTSSYVYDADGRVIQATDQATGVRTWERTKLGPSFTVTSSTPLGRETVQTISRSSDGSKRSTRTDAAGLSDVTTRNQDGSLTREFADGTSVSSTDVTDVPLAVSALRRDTTIVTLPSGLSSTVVTVRERTVETTGDPLSVSGTTATIRQLGSTGAWEVSHDADAALVTVRSPEGRETESSLDAKGRAASFRSGTDATVSVTRDGQGRPTEVRQGARASGLAYGANGLVSTVTDPLTRTTQSFYDKADRLTRQVLADGREIAIGYDARSNPTSITPAGRPAHTYAYSPVNLVTEYRPPAVDASDPATRFSYDLDRALTSITRPDGLTVGMVYDAAGRIQEVGFPDGMVEFGYDAVTGNLIGVNAPYGGALSMSYDGALPTQVQWTGEVDGTVGMSYDNAFRVSQLTVNGADPVSYAYDEDDLLVQVGALIATQDAVNGRLTGTTLGSLSTSQSYSGFGELGSMAATYASTSLLEATYTRDALGRIATKVEVLGGSTTTYAYTYDLTGRLTQVTADGVAVEAYAYDTNGNRTSFTGAGGGRCGHVRRAGPTAHLRLQQLHLHRGGRPDVEGSGREHDRLHVRRARESAAREPARRNRHRVRGGRCGSQDWPQGQRSARAWVAV